MLAHSDIVTSGDSGFCATKTSKLTTTPAAHRWEPFPGEKMAKAKAGGDGGDFIRSFSSTFFQPGPCLHTPGTDRSVSGVGGERERSATWDTLPTLRSQFFLPKSR